MKRSLLVLVVDDETLLRWSISDVLRRSGQTVLEATSAREVMTETSEPIDVVFLATYGFPIERSLARR